MVHPMNTVTGAINWQTIPNKGEAGTLERARTPGGWLVRETHNVLHNHPQGGPFTDGYEWRTSLVYVPDPEGSWLKERVA